MTSRETRGGPRVPDGVPRPSALPFGGNVANRTDLSELPGTPGTPLPPSPVEPTVQHGDVGRLRNALSQIPLNKFQAPSVDLSAPSNAPDEPITAGLGMGPGPGPEGLIPSPQQLSGKLTSQEMKYAYPLLARLAALPGATTETKILAQRLRANLPLKPEQLPVLESPDGLRRPTQ